MKLILDTHILLWAMSQPERIDRARLDCIEDLSNTVYVSAVSVAEIAIKSSIGKLVVDFDLLDVIGQSGFEALDFTARDACHFSGINGALYRLRKRCRNRISSRSCSANDLSITASRIPGIRRVMRSSRLLCQAAAHTAIPVVVLLDEVQVLRQLGTRRGSGRARSGCRRISGQTR